jgi:hypothetical protein
MGTMLYALVLSSTRRCTRTNPVSVVDYGLQGSVQDLPNIGGVHRYMVRLECTTKFWERCVGNGVRPRVPIRIILYIIRGDNENNKFYLSPESCREQLA